MEIDRHVSVDTHPCGLQVGIVHDIRLQELRLYTDYGRTCRPLFIVDLGQQRLRIRKDDIRLLQDREESNVGWQVGPSMSSDQGRWYRRPPCPAPISWAPLSSFADCTGASASLHGHACLGAVGMSSPAVQD